MLLSSRSVPDCWWIQNTPTHQRKAYLLTISWLCGPDLFILAERKGGAQFWFPRRTTHEREERDTNFRTQPFGLSWGFLLSIDLFLFPFLALHGSDAPSLGNIFVGDGHSSLNSMQPRMALTTPHRKISANRESRCKPSSPTCENLEKLRIQVF